MRKIHIFFLLLLLFSAGSAMGQTYPRGLIGLSSNEPGILYVIDSSDGSASQITELNGGASITGLSFLHGVLYGTDLYDFPGSIPSDNAIGSISPNGIITFLGNQDLSANWHGLASDEANGVLYVVNYNNSILTVQHLDGSTETVGSGVGFNVPGLAYDDANHILYGISEDRLLYTISTETGSPNLIGPTGIQSKGNSIGLAYDECSQILYANDGILGELYILDVNSGAATLVGSNSVRDEIDGLAWNGRCGPNPIPTLSEWGLISAAVGFGLIGLFFVLKRRKSEVRV